MNRHRAKLGRRLFGLTLAVVGVMALPIDWHALAREAAYVAVGLRQPAAVTADTMQMEASSAVVRPMASKVFQLSAVKVRARSAS